MEAKARKVIKRCKKVSFQNFCKTLYFGSSSTRVWNFIRSIVGVGILYSFSSPQNGVVLVDDFAKAEVMAVYDRSIIGNEMVSENEGSMQQYVIGCIEDDSVLEINQHFSLYELKEQIKTLKFRKSVGVMTANEMLANFWMKSCCPFCYKALFS